MLLNPSHKITSSGLPSDVLDAYVRYKKGTRALVAWFLQYSPYPDRKLKSLPIKELESLAQIASKSLRSLPDVVHFYFRETIAARKRLSKYFRGQVDGADDDVDTINHEHFTASLAQIYNELRATCDSNAHHQGSRLRQRGSSSAMADRDSAINLYEGLTVEDIDDHAIEESHSLAATSCPECTIAPSSSCDGTGMEVHFLDDDLSTALEVMGFMQRITSISSSVEHCWHLVGKGELSFTAAAFVTNVAFSMLRQVGIEILEHDVHLSISKLHEICCSLSPSSSSAVTASRESPSDAPTNVHLFLEDLQKTEQSLIHYRDGHSQMVCSSCSSCCVQKPADYMQSASSSNEQHDSTDNAHRRLVEVVTENIIRLVTSPGAPSNIVRNSTPVYADVGYLVTRTDQNCQPWSAVLGLDLLTKGYKSYHQSLIGSPKASLSFSSCRINALKLAQQASSQVSAILVDKTCFPCRCTQTLAYHLQNLEADLQSYARHKCWDVYFQLPWVAGNHILEILDLCRYYGLRLFHYRHYVGAVLHSYNVLRQLGRLDEIPVLESLCEQFCGLYFPGGSRPKASFRGCWSRYVGARLKFKKGHKSRSSQDAWCMAIPAYAARKAAGLGGSPSDDQDLVGVEAIDGLVIKVKQQDYHLSEDLWSQVDEVSASASASARRSSKSSVRKRSSATAPTADSSEQQQQHQQRLLDLAQVANQSLAGDSNNNMPLARLNMFAVFEKCVRVVSTLSDETHSGPKEERGLNCICFASAILAGGDRIVDGRRLGRLETWKKDERQCVDRFQKAVQDVFGPGVKEEDFLWAV